MAFCTLLCSLYCCITHSPDPEYIPAAGPDAFMTEEIYGLLKWDNKALFNNCWDFDSLRNKERASSIIFYDPATSICGWRWSCPKEAVEKLKGYPCLIVGDKVYMPAGYDPSTDPRFPLHLPDMKSLIAHGEINVTGSGDYDFAYDLAFLEGYFSRPETVRSEIMVWLKASQVCSAEKKGEYTINGYTYDFFVNTTWNPTVPYLAFVLKGKTLPQHIPLHEFIRIGIKEGYVDPNAWLAAIELGPEIWWGDGEAWVRDFRISLNGD